MIRRAGPLRFCAVEPGISLRAATLAVRRTLPRLPVSPHRRGSRHMTGLPDASLMLRQAVAIARRILIEYVRQRRSLIFWAAFPALMLLLFGLIYRNNESMRGSFDTTPAGILIGAALFFSCLGGTVSIIVAERERRTLRRLLISPLNPVAYFLGIVLALSLVAVAQAAIVYAVAYPLGARYRGSVGLGVLIVALSVFAYVGLGFFFGARFAKRAEDVNGPVAAFGVPLLVLAGTFFPIQLLPPFLLKVAWFDPVFHMNEAMKGVSGRGQGWDVLYGDVLFLAAFAAVALGLGIASYRRMLTEEKRS
jgi:ABC-2 type transport system permease protein